MHIHTSPRAPRNLPYEGSTLEYADLCVRVLAWLRQNRPDARLHVSLAGGRKTMSFYLGYARLLLGQPEDQLSHVLVRPSAFEGPDFRWPGTPPEVLRHGLWLATADATVDLVPVPFAPMSAYVDASLLQGPIAGKGTDRRLVGRVKDRLVPELRLDPASRRVVFGSGKIELPPSQYANQYALLHVLATAWHEQWPGWGPQGQGGCGWLIWDDFDPDGRAARLLARIYPSLLRPSSRSWEVIAIYTAARQGWDWSKHWPDLRDKLEQARAKLQRQLQTLPPVGIRRLRIVSRRIISTGAGEQRQQLHVFGLTGVDPTRIHFAKTEDPPPQNGCRSWEHS